MGVKNQKKMGGRRKWVPRIRTQRVADVNGCQESERN